MSENELFNILNNNGKQNYKESLHRYKEVHHIMLLILF